MQNKKPAFTLLTMPIYYSCIHPLGPLTRMCCAFLHEYCFCLTITDLFSPFSLIRHKVRSGLQSSKQVRAKFQVSRGYAWDVQRTMSWYSPIFTCLWLFLLPYFFNYELILFFVFFGFLEYPIVSIEDPFDKEDWEHVKQFSSLGICQVCSVFLSSEL